MRFAPDSLLWRTLGVLVAALVLSQAAAFWLFEEYVSRPRAALATRHFVSHLKSLNAALQTMDDAQQRAFINRIAEQDGVRIVSVRGQERLRPAPDRPGLQLFRERIRESFGPAADVYVREPGAGDVHRVLWVRLPTGERQYWVAFPRGRVERDPIPAVIAWAFAGLLIAVLGTFLIVWRLNRPIGDLAEAAATLGRGGDPPPVPERGPGEIRSLARAFNQMKEDLRAASRERTTFLAGLSHDLRTPLARLRLDLEMLEGRIDAAAQREMVADVDDMSKIIDQFVDYGRSEAAERAEPTDLAELAHACAERAERSGAKVRRNLSAVPTVVVRPLAMQRLVDNLLANAVRHGGGDVTLSTSQLGSRVELSVLDRGPGIAPGEVERLKKPFTRRDDARTGATGAGLGLAIAERVAILHGGTLDLLPREGGGLHARLTLPI